MSWAGGAAVMRPRCRISKWQVTQSPARLERSSPPPWPRNFR